VPPSHDVKYQGGIVGSRLANYLLKAGQHEAVATYYDRMATINVLEGKYLTESAQAIRAGRMPSGYQRFTEREAGR
jgi:hypothetical protein